MRSLRGAFARVAPLAVAAISLASPALANDGDDALAKMQHAITSAHSFSAFTVPTIPMTWIVVQPDRMRRVRTTRDGMADWIVIGSESYSRVADRPWESTWLPSGGGIRWEEIAAFLREGTTARALPDRAEGGILVGVLDVLISEKRFANGTSIQPFHITCSYEKVTFRPRTCELVTIAAFHVTVTYENWNDPSNAVDRPAGLAAPTPAPSTAPSPGPAATQ